MVGFERRRNKRYRVPAGVEVELARADHTLTAALENLSVGGALVRVRGGKRFRMGERIRIAFAPPGSQEPIDADADVRWVSDTGRVGVQFTGSLSAPALASLNQFLERIGGDAA